MSCGQKQLKMIQISKEKIFESPIAEESFESDESDEAKADEIINR